MGEALIKPIYDDKITRILRGLAEGKRREEISLELGYKDYKGLDMYMRRKNWKWNGKIHNYEVEVPKLAFEDRLNKVKIAGTRVGKVIALFDSGLEDMLEVANKAEFRTHVEMAEYMKRNNCSWDSEKGNYIMKTGKVEDNEPTKDIPKEPIEQQLEELNVLGVVGGIDINQYLPLLKMLQSNNDREMENFNPEKQAQCIPTYLLPGITTVLSASMMSSLKMLLKEFSSEKHVTQRQVLEVALIEFFNKYGYSHRASAMLNA
ncbi:hypothetical protein K9O30_01745 [Clostridium bowmanii]|uniref:hypothetical protein n=1 Tax=Clostridium bowmanii TaxID=132925 RepID=UPI001C0E7348|nr:hypothetical protein [Clostridium bowmanii]MBU3190307.1 hypothetical protein [Clostridium bowmanii]MCA1072481.1 hypothetical protein [Clostridium bowmanii]